MRPLACLSADAVVLGRCGARTAVACDVHLRRGEGRLLALLVVAYGWLFVFFERINNPNELVRVYAARALIEDGTWSIGTRSCGRAASSTQVPSSAIGVT